ncbi:IS630 family transposase [Streptomyces sp. NPDC101213]|uniref:IS630 family transposase n=1 Tax=Streptomyces sp. NPDC101213 TaxID=3366130 RepID=UPI0038031DE9
MNAMSAISTKGRMHFMVFAESFTAEVMCRFLDRLVGHFDHKVHLVADGHSAHRSRKVRDWLAAHPDDVELHFLPAYSPELNPDELVNADLKHSLPRQHRARDQAELAAETRRFFRRCQRQPHIARGYFGRPHRPLRPGPEPHEFLINTAPLRNPATESTHTDILHCEAASAFT